MLLRIVQEIRSWSSKDEGMKFRKERGEGDENVERWLENDAINSISLRDKLSSLVGASFQGNLHLPSNYTYITSVYIYIYIQG